MGVTVPSSDKRRRHRFRCALRYALSAGLALVGGCAADVADTPSGSQGELNAEAAPPIFARFFLSEAGTTLAIDVPFHPPLSGAADVPPHRCWYHLKGEAFSRAFAGEVQETERLSKLTIDAFLAGAQRITLNRIQDAQIEAAGKARQNAWVWSAVDAYQSCSERGSGLLALLSLAECGSALRGGRASLEGRGTAQAAAPEAWTKTFAQIAVLETREELHKPLLADVTAVGELKSPGSCPQVGMPRLRERLLEVAGLRPQ